MTLAEMKDLTEGYIKMFAPQEDTPQIPGNMLKHQINLESQNHHTLTKKMTGVKLMLAVSDQNRYIMPSTLLQIHYLTIGSERYYPNAKVIVKETSIDE